MNDFDRIRSTLLDLARALRDDDIPLIVGGGFGLYLKQENLQANDASTLLRLPEPRSTNDIDLFLRVDVLAKLSAAQRIAHILEGMGFRALQQARYFQWLRELADGHSVKLDLLVGPLGAFKNQLKIARPRARPRGDVRLHAHMTPEAIDIDSRSKQIEVTGICTDGERFSTPIYVPQAFTYLLMKLFAFDDRKDDYRRDVGRHHAMDLYRIVAMMTESELQEAIALASRHGSNRHVERARGIIKSQFAIPTAIGILRLREHPLFQKEFDVDTLIEMGVTRIPRVVAGGFTRSCGKC